MYPERPRRTDNLKAPKLRFYPNSFIRHNKTGELFCITLAYRFIAEPNIWRFDLEVREGLGNPETPMSFACKTIAGEPVSNRIIKEPIWNTSDNKYINRTYNDYHFGDGLIGISTKELLNNYTLVSSGEVNTTKMVKEGNNVY